MKYILLLRGINVGGNRIFEMERLRKILESLGYTKVVTYLNSGNAIFESDSDREKIQQEISRGIKNELGFDIAILIKTDQEIKKIASAIPKNWENDSSQRTDVAYLFPQIDSAKIIDELPLKREFIDVRYIKGAIYWNVKRENVYKCQLAKLISNKIYKLMTIRNVNTVRYLAEHKY